MIPLAFCLHLVSKIEINLAWSHIHKMVCAFLIKIVVTLAVCCDSTVSLLTLQVDC